MINQEGYCISSQSTSIKLDPNDAQSTFKGGIVKSTNRSHVENITMPPMARTISVIIISDSTLDNKLPYLELSPSHSDILFLV